MSHLAMDTSNSMQLQAMTMAVLIKLFNIVWVAVGCGAHLNSLFIISCK